MTTSLMVMLGCLLLTSYIMAIYVPRPFYLRDVDGGDTEVADAKEVLNAFKAKVDDDVPKEFQKPLGDLLTAMREKLDKAQGDQTVEVTVPQARHQDSSQDNKYDVDRRQFNPNVDLGGGWSAGLGGLKWQSDSGRTTFSVKPTFNGFKPDGFQAGLQFNF